MARDLAEQLTGIFQAGLKSDPALAQTLLAGAEDDTAEGKATKLEAHYRPAEGEESCSSCSHFNGTASCDVVSGRVSPDGLSDLYEPAGETKAEAAMTPPTTEGTSG